MDFLYNGGDRVVMMLIINYALFLVLFGLALTAIVRYRKLKQKYDAFMQGSDGKSMDKLVEEYLYKVNELKKRSKDFENKLNYIERNIMQCMQKVGIVKYNAFDNMGGELSFSLALLDSHDGGMVLSGIYTRDGSSVYIKQVNNGQSKHALSAEEIQAIDIAKKSFGERLYTEGGSLGQ